LQRRQLPKNYIIKNALLWSSSSDPRRCDILVEGGVVSKIEDRIDPPAGTEEIHAKGQSLLPIGVDPQVHLRVPGQPQKELPITGLRAAVRGGVGAVLTMPNTVPTIDNPEVCRLAVEELKKASMETGVQVLLSGAITKDLKGQVTTDYDTLHQSGVAAFTDDGIGVESDEIMAEVFAASERTGLPVLQHAEYAGHKGVLAQGPMQEKLGTPAYPSAAESDMVKRDIEVLRRFPKARYHVLHVSSRHTLELVKAAKKEGLPVTCEASPHHLLFSSEDIKEDNTGFKMNPPLRSPADRQALQDGLASGLVDFVATDHAPHEPEAKGNNFKTSAYGTIGLEASLRVLLKLNSEGKLPSQRLVQVFSKRPAQFLGLDSSYGDISPGSPLRAILVDTESEPSAFSSGDIESHSKNCCFLGAVLPGKPILSINDEHCFDFSNT